jgi:hypothetical protein
MPLAIKDSDTIGGKVDAGADVNYFIDGDQITAAADDYDLLATGQLPTVAAALYTVPASKNAIVGHIRLHNTGTSVRIVTLYRNGTATGNVWAVLALASGEGAEWVDGEGWILYDSNGLRKENQTMPQGYALRSVSEIAQGTVAYTPPAGVRALMVHCVGAGGGGGGCTTVAAQAAAGGGGGSGAYSRKLVTSPKSSYTVAVGTGGTAGANTGGTGGTGGDTTFDSPAVVTAKGGAGGVGQTANTTVASAAGGAGGDAASGVGDTRIDGNEGTAAFRLSGTQAVPGDGAPAPGPFGGGRVGTDANGAGVTGKQWGGSGSGALVQNGSAAAAGGVGANGRLVIEEYF